MGHLWNFESKDAGEETFSAGADSAAFRILIWMCSKFQWEACTLDVKTAFLNAKMNQKEDEQLILILPPAFFAERGFLERDTYFVPQKAVYGLRRSPRLWGEHRDETLEKFIIVIDEGEEAPKKKAQLMAMDSEPNLWKVVPFSDDHDEEKEADLLGLVMTYVDDIFVAGPHHVEESSCAEDPGPAHLGHLST